MTDRRRIAARLAIAAGIVTVAVVAVLIVGQVIVMSRAPAEART